MSYIVIPYLVASLPTTLQQNSPQPKQDLVHEAMRLYHNPAFHFHELELLKTKLAKPQKDP